MPIAKVTTFTVRSRTYKMLFTGSGVADVEQVLGEGLEESLQKRGYRNAIAYLHEGIRRGMSDDRFSLKETRILIDNATADGMSYIDLWEVINRALQDSGVLKVERGDPLAPSESAPLRSISDE